MITPTIGRKVATRVPSLEKQSGLPGKRGVPVEVSRMQFLSSLDLIRNEPSGLKSNSSLDIAESFHLLCCGAVPRTAIFDFGMLPCQTSGIILARSVGTGWFRSWIGFTSLGVE